MTDGEDCSVSNDLRVGRACPSNAPGELCIELECGQNFAVSGVARSLSCIFALLVASGCDDDHEFFPVHDAGAPRAQRDVPATGSAPTNWGRGFVDLSNSLEASAQALYLRVPSRMGEDPEPIAAIGADVDGDGASEVIFATTYDNSMDRRSAVIDVNPAAQTARFRGHFTTMGGADRLNVVGMFDLDGDGNIDALLNRADYELAWGLGGGRFAQPESLRGSIGPWRPLHRAMHVTDLDDDGWLDVITGSSQCCTDCRAAEVYLRAGPRSFVRRDEVLVMEPGATAYAIVDGRVAGRRTVMMVGQNCGNTDVPVFYREAGLSADGLPRYEGYDPTPVESFIRTSDGAWPSVSSFSIQNWVPMGVALGDVDSDLRDDVAISLNFFAGLWLDEGRLPLTDETEQFGARPLLAASGRRMIPWGIAVVDLDQDGRGELVVAHGNDHQSTVDPAAHIGPQRTTIAWNRGGGRFIDVTAELGVGREGQYRSLYVDDLDRDGDADLLVGSAEEHPRIFLNHINRGGHGFSLRLRGTSSNRLGIGSRVRVEVTPGGAVQEYSVGTVGAPGVAADPITFVGLGPATVASRVQVTWPSGVVQSRENVPAGTLHVWEEPQLFTLEPASRHVARGGAASIRVTPRALDGSVRLNATVSLRVRGGAAVPLRATNGGYEGTIAHPGHPGSSVLEVSVDEVAAGVRPRVWWD